MNMKILKKSRKTPQPGDVFVLQIVEAEFMFGRVINCRTRIGNFDGVIMIYIYDARSAGKTDIPTLRRGRLLIPPLGTNRQPWLKGYFETVANEPLSKSDILTTHCFERLSPVDDRVIGYVDEQNNPLRGRLEPCGVYGLHSYRTIDDAISRALGLSPYKA